MGLLVKAMEMTAYRHKVSFLGDKNVLGLDSGDV